MPDQQQANTQQPQQAQQAQAQQAQAQAQGQTHGQTGPGVQALEHVMLARRGPPEVSAVAEIVGDYPGDRDAIFQLLHTKLGNAYVQQVMARVQANGAAAKDASAPQTTATATTTTTATAGAAQAQPSSWESFKQTAGDTAELAYEIMHLAAFNVFNGNFDGEIDVGKLLHYAQLFVPVDALRMIVLYAAQRGTNMVYVKGNLYHKTLDVSAPNLKIAGFHNPAFTAGACDLQGLTAHAANNTVHATFARADFHDVTFIRGGDKLGAQELVMTSLAVDASDGNALAGDLKFASAKLHGMQYPDMPPIDLDLPSGANFDAVWAKAAGKTPKHAPDAPPSPLPHADVLPHGSRITIQLDGLHAGAAGGTASTTGAGGFTHMHAALVQDGRELVSITIDGFSAGGAAGAATSGDATIDQLAIKGDPALVNTLLQSPELANRPAVKSAVDLVKSVGLSPAVSGTINAHHITASAGAAGEQARGDFDGDVDIPQLGLLHIDLTGMQVGESAGATPTASTSFDKLALTLHDHAQPKQEIAYLELDGGAGTLKGDKRHAVVKQLAARGAVGKLVSAGDSIVSHLPPATRSAMKAVAALGISGQITGSVTVDGEGKHDAISGDFDIEVAAGKAGSVSLRVAGFHSKDTGAVSFGQFNATLRDPHGKQAATVAISQGASSAATPGAASAFTAKHIDAHGDDASLNAMIAAIQAQSTALPAPIRTSFAMVRRFYSQAGGEIAMANVSATTDRAGNDVARASNINANFELAGAGKAVVELTGFHTVLGAKSDQVDFSHFGATLTDANGKQAARVQIEGSSDSFATETPGGATPDFDMRAKQVVVDGNSHEVATLLAGLTQHLSTLPQPIAAAFRTIEKYGNQIAATGTVTASNLALSSKDGKLAGHTDLTARVAVKDGELDATLTGAHSDGEQLGFDALDVTLRDRDGTVAGSLHAANAKADASGKSAGLGALEVHGDGKRLRAVLDPNIQKAMPAALGRALAMLDGSALDASVTGVSVAETAGGDVQAQAKTMHVSGAIEVNDSKGNVYTCKDASLELDGAQLQLGADKKPREVDATAMAISGQFSSSGTGNALSGSVTLQTGAAHIMFDANGKPTKVTVSRVFAAGNATSVAAARPAATTTAGPAAAPTTTQRLAQHDAEAHAAEDVAQAIRSADISAQVPLFAGRYGRGLESLGVDAGTTVNVSVQVRNNELTNETSVHIAPPLELPAGLKAQGVDLQTKGREGILKARVGGLLGFVVPKDLTKYAVGKGSPMSLDLPQLVDEVMGNIRAGIVAAKPATTPSDADSAKAAKHAADDESWLDKQHDKWERDVAKHERDDAKRSATDRAKREAKDKGAEPRSADIADLASKGVDLADASASADVVLAKADNEATITGHLHGQGTGGGKLQLQLTADQLATNVAGNAVSATGVDSGQVAIAETGNTTHVELNGLKIDDLQWSATTTTATATTR